MKKVGGIIALIAGVLGVCGAGITLVFGGLGAVFEVEGMDTVIILWWGEVLFSFLIIILGAIAMGAKGRMPGMLLIVCAIVGAILGGTFVAIFMVFAAAGGMLAVVGKRKMPAPPTPTALPSRARCP